MSNDEIDGLIEEEKTNRLHIALISIHGLIRGENLELGRDSDTGGQTKYVVELARALSMNPRVGRVDIYTRMVFDKKIDKIYSEKIETISEKANIIRIPCGPKRYIRKEMLWNYLDSFTDSVLRSIRRSGEKPDIVHAHYADAGYVGAHLSDMLGVPLVFTGHSLGRVKKERLLGKGMSPETIEGRYNISTRIGAEELALKKARLVVTNSNQEIDSQYKSYGNSNPSRQVAIPTGVDLSRFYSKFYVWTQPNIYNHIVKFLDDPKKPMILCVSRPDPRKNISALLHAYGQSEELQQIANLVLITGVREDIAEMEKGPQEVLSDILMLIDKYDLYGKVAYPKQHDADDVPSMYRVAARTKGVFVNPALTEPFGLTLIEAAASGLPMVATNNGGPKEIVRLCKNGLLVDTSDVSNISETLHIALTSKDQWKRWSNNGIKGAKEHYSWEGHVKKYVRIISRILRKTSVSKNISPYDRLVNLEKIFISDIDNTLTGDSEGLQKLMSLIGDRKKRVGFGVATGRSLKKTLQALKKWGIPRPDILITSVGSEIYYGQKLIPDMAWRSYINYKWEPNRVRSLMEEFDGIELQADADQRKHKISYFFDGRKAPSIEEIKRRIKDEKLLVNVIFSHQQYLDILPIRASKGNAVTYLSKKWAIPADKILTAGDSGNDSEMLSCECLGVVVGNHSSELDNLRGKSRIYFSDENNAWGIIEGIEKYGFLSGTQT